MACKLVSVLLFGHKMFGFWPSWPRHSLFLLNLKLLIKFLNYWQIKIKLQEMGTVREIMQEGILGKVTLLPKDILAKEIVWEIKRKSEIEKVKN